MSPTGAVDHRLGRGPARHRRHQRATSRRASTPPTSGSSSARASASGASAGRCRRWPSRPGAAALERAALAPGAGRPARAGHLHARPGRAGHLGRGAPRARALAAAPSTSTPPAPGSSTRWWRPTAPSAPARRAGSCSSAPTACRCITDPDDRATAVLFADGAGAVVLEASDDDGAAGGRPRRRRQRARPAHLRARRLHADGGERGLPPCRAHHRRVGLERARTGQAHARRHRPVRPPPGQPAHHRSGRVAARASPWTASPSSSTARATPRAPRSPWRSPTPPTPGGSRPGDHVLMSGFGAGMAWASAVVRWAGRHAAAPARTGAVRRRSTP